ncbi:hypothetical protein B5M09_007112 [Aphanomyces astaci]|nr:hypothetical protein B5M09_007112 [Aphanomyces astaci]
MTTNLQRQLDAYAAAMGVPMPAEMARHAISQLFVLEKLFFEDPPHPTSVLHDPTHWTALVGGSSLHVTSSPLANSAFSITSSSSKFSTDDATGTSVVLSEQGYTVLDPFAQANHTTYSLAALEAGVHALHAAGYPPAFIFVFDEAWAYLDAVWGAVYEPLLGPGCVLEADLNCWHLHRPVSQTTASNPYIGVNFGAAHRDLGFDQCHDADEQFTSLTCWLPLNRHGATADNGCMHVVPIDADDFFYAPHHPQHRRSVHSPSAVPLIVP